MEFVVLKQKENLRVGVWRKKKGSFDIIENNDNVFVEHIDNICCTSLVRIQNGKIHRNEDRIILLVKNEDLLEEMIEFSKGLFNKIINIEKN